MIIRLRLVLVVLIVGLSLGQTALLSPGQITWWKGKWAPGGVRLSVNNRATTGVSATFYANFASGLTAGVVEVGLPADFTVAASSGQTVNGNIVQVSGLTFAPGQDNTVTVTGITTPSSVGGYGPFSLRTRSSANGQQVDANLLFASVYICSDAGVFSSFSVSSGVKPAINQGSLTLSFKVTISVALWKYDTFVITTDTMWTVSTTAVCTSADYSGRVNNFNGTDAANPHIVQCLTTAKSTGSAQKVYIYGLAVEDFDPRTEDNKYVDLRVSGVTAPDAAYPANTFTWSLETYRFGTSTMLETGSYTAGPEVRNDNMTTATWTPTWGFPLSAIPSGLSLFMDLTFTVKNPIPAGGSIEIIFSEDVSTGDGNWMTPVNNCYVATFLSRDVRCTVITGRLRLTSLPTIAAGTSIRLRSIVKVTHGANEVASVKSIATYQTTVAANILLEIGYDLAGFTVSNSTSLLKSFALQTQSSLDLNSTLSNYAGGTGNYTQAIQFALVGNPQADFTATSNFTVECPFAAGMADFAIGIPSVVTYAYKDSASLNKTDMTGLSALTTNLPALSVSASSASLGSLSFRGDIGSPLTLGLHLLMYTDSSSTAYITLPRVQSNLATTYECYARMLTDGKPAQRSALRFYVDTQVLAAKSWTLPCKDNIDGVPGRFIFKPSVFPIEASTASRTYYVEIQFPGDFAMGSGLPAASISTPDFADALSFAVEYPHDKDIVADTVARLYYASGNNYVAIGGLPALSPDAVNPLSIWIPLGGMTGAVTPTVRGFFISAADPRYKFITHEDYLKSLTFYPPTNSLFPTADVIPGTNLQVNGEKHSSGLVLNLTTEAIAVEHSFYFLLPAGFQWASTKNVRLLPSTDYTLVKFFSSSNRAFAFPSVLVNISTSGLALPATGGPTGTISLSGFILPVGTGTANITVVLGPDATSNNCTHVSFIPFTSVPGEIHALTIKPNSVKGRGPDGINVYHSVSFTLPHGIPLGGSLQIDISDQWKWTNCSTCNVTGLFPASTGGSVLCDFSVDVLTISSFADFAGNKSVVVTVGFTQLLPPPFNATGTGELFVVNITSYTGTQIIDYLLDPAGSLVLVAAPSAPGNATIFSLRATPNLVGALGVGLSLKFALAHSLPSCGVITVTSPYSFKQTGSMVNSCFLSSLQYKDCSVSDGKLTITLAQDYQAGSTLDLFLENAIDLTTVPGGFSVSSAWGGFAVDYDQTAVAGVALQTVPRPAGTISALGIGINPRNAAESATYQLRLKSSQDFASGDALWVVFPRQFDYFLGETETPFSAQPTQHYMTCSSPQLAALSCSVASRTLVVTSPSTVAAGTELLLVVNRVSNPAVGATDSFQLFHFSAAGDVKASNQAFGAVSPVALAGNIDVKSQKAHYLCEKSLKLTEGRLFKVSDYQWKLFLTERVNTDSELKVLFPPEFDLELVDQKDFYACSTTSLDLTAANRTEKVWNAASQCVVFGNEVVLPSPSVAASFSASTQVTWTLREVTNAKWTLPRVDLGTDFEVTDKVLWSGSNAFSSKFEFFLYRTSQSSLAYTLRSYHNMNSAYATFGTFGVKQLFVVDAQGGSNRITLYPGTQSTDLYVSTGSASQPVSAKALAFTASTNTRSPDSGKLKYTSVSDNWVLLQGYWRMRFRVAASVDMQAGLYYFDLALKESRQTGRSEDEYAAPASVLVEVMKKTAKKYALAVASVPPVAIGSSSLPVKVTLTNSPHTQLLLDIAVTDGGTKVVVSPGTLVFSPDISERSFRMQVSANYDLSFSKTAKLTLTLGGDDAYAFSVPQTVELGIIEANSNVAPGSVQSWGLGKVTKTSASATPVTDQTGILYYQLAVSGKTTPSFSALKQAAEALPERNTTSLRPVSSDSSAVEVEPRSGESWTDFQRRTYKNHRNTVWIGSLPIFTVTGGSTIPLEGLFADTEYQIIGYLDNLMSKTEPSSYLEKFRTSSIPDCQPMSVKFNGTLDRSWSDKVTQELAAVMGVNALRLSGPTFSRRRALQASTTLAYTLVASRSVEVPTPSEQSTLSPDSLTTLTSNLKAQGVPNSLDSVSRASAPSRQQPQWSVAPQVLETNYTSVTISLLASVAGSACCLPLSEEQAVTADDVITGSTGANSTCALTDPRSTSEVRVAGLTSGKKYFVYCTAADSYPLWPTLMKDSPTALEVTTLRFTAPSGTESEARWLQCMALILLNV